MLGPEYISFQPAEHTFSLVDKKETTTLFYSDNEHESVKRALKDLQHDFYKVTKQQPEIKASFPDQPRAVVIATLGKKEWVTRLIADAHIDVSVLENKWESFLIQTIDSPYPGIEEILLILGSDNRGTIFGMYDLSEKIGVSPWYWWMDVPNPFHPEIYVKNGRYLQGEPSVQYRGFFLNDEGPSLMTWVRKNYPDFTHEFYEKIFELTLRLKANYHWPAMWDSTFYEDDEQNIVTAERYGVVIGTSHHEPMNRPHGDWKKHKKGPWDYHTNNEVLSQFWKEGIERSKDYETIINLGMRGDGDEEMGGDLSFEEKIQLLEKIVEDQRTIIQETHKDKEVDEVPQLWALYKEVKEYYDSGMTVPEDVTLLWGDDNFGNIRRLPTDEERNRKGGAGIYYHLDYVGGPRNYKWVNTVPVQKIWEQMHKAYEYDAKKIWILNVGDLKPMEFQTEFFLRMAWNIHDFSKDTLWDYSVRWATSLFGEKYGQSVAEVIRDYSKYNGRLKPEMLNGVELYSQTHYQEAERVLKEFEKTVEKAEQLMLMLPEELKDPFFQVAYYPAKASYVVLKLHVLAERSKLYAKQERTAANAAAREAELLFLEDEALAFDYNRRTALGKWNHMMDQTHIGYTYWQQPEKNVMPEVVRIEPQNEGAMGIRSVGSLTSDVFTKKKIAVDIFNKGKEPFEFQIKPFQKWLLVSTESSAVHTQTRVFLSVNWDNVPQGEEVEGKVTFSSTTGEEETITVHVHNPSPATIDEMKGFVPVDGVISIEAEHYSRKKDTVSHSWEVVPDYGRTSSSMAVFPVKLSEEYPLEEAPSMEYDVYIPDKGTFDVSLLLAPSLDCIPGKGLRIGISMDDQPVQVINAIQYEEDGAFHYEDWAKSVIYNVREAKMAIQVDEPGNHVLKLTLIDPAVVVQKVMLNLGGLEPSYLGPPETPQTDKTFETNPIEEVSDYVTVPGTFAFTKEEVLVFIEKTGLYQFVWLDEEATNVKIVCDGEPLLSQKTGDDHSVYHLTAGYHLLAHSDGESKSAHSLSSVLLEEDVLHIRPSIRVEKDNPTEIIVQMGCLSKNKFSHRYRINYTLRDKENRLIGEDCILNTLEKNGKDMWNKGFMDSEKSSEYKIEVEWTAGGRSRKRQFQHRVNRENE